MMGGTARIRRWVVGLLGLGLLAGCAAPRPPADPLGTVVTVYFSPTCGCCKEWIRYLQAHGVQVHGVLQDDLRPLKERLGVPEAVRSCHTARVGPYTVEGHVPVEAIARLLQERPPVAGIAVPGMPAGAPGMGGTPAGPLEIVAFFPDGRFTVWMRR